MGIATHMMKSGARICGSTDARAFETVNPRQVSCPDCKRLMKPRPTTLTFHGETGEDSVDADSLWFAALDADDNPRWHDLSDDGPWLPTPPGCPAPHPEAP